jgi:hypothetical protein
MVCHPRNLLDYIGRKSEHKLSFVFPSIIVN